MRDENLFWEIVHTAPYREADEMLRVRRADAMERRYVALKNRNNIEANRIDALLSRINTELHLLNRTNRDHQIQIAIRTLYGDEAWEAVKIWMLENVPEVA